MSAMYTAESLEAMNYRELQACCKANGQRAAGKVSRTTRGAHCSARLAAPRASLRSVSPVRAEHASPLCDRSA